MQAVRNVAIVVALALGIALLPGGGNAATAVLTALAMGFLTVIGWAAYRLYRERWMTLDALSDGRRATLYGALGVIALMLVWSDDAFARGGAEVLVWIGAVGLAVFAIVRVWVDASSYS